MASEPTITLYDIPSTLEIQTWSPNTWKARIVLNYKRIPHKTVWVSYPDIEPTLKSIGGVPTDTTPDGKPLYTLPAIVDTTSGSPVVIVDSLAIAEYLEEKFPDHPIFPKNGKALEYAFERAFSAIIGPHIGKIAVPAAWHILDDRGKVYFRETRERWYEQYGKTLEDWIPAGAEREAAWDRLEQAWDKLAGILDKNGPSVDYVAGGTNPTRADFIIVSYLGWLVAVAPEQWEKRLVNSSGGRWGRLWKLTEEWRAIH